MKKVTLCALAITALFTINANAQSSTSSKIERTIKEYRLGIFLGLGSTSLRPKGTETDNYTVAKDKGKIATSIGLTAEKNFDDRYAVYSGIGMDWSGGSMTSTIKPNTSVSNDSSYARLANVKYKLQHVTIPLGIKMKAANLDNIRLYAQAGADLGILIGKKADYTINRNVLTPQSTSKENIKLEGTSVAPIQIGWSCGIGAEYALTQKNAVTATILYHNAFLPNLTDPMKLTDATKGQYRFEDGKTVSNAVTLRIGYFF